MKRRLAEEIGEDLADAVTIEPLAIQEEFTRLPADLAYRNELYARAYRRFLVKKQVADEVYARLMIEIREALENEGKKATEAAVKAQVEISPEWHAAKMEAIEAEVDKVRAWGECDAVRTKRDALISIGAHIRAEMGGDPRIRGEFRAVREVQASKGWPYDDSE